MIEVYFHENFGEDPCTHKRVQGVNMRAHTHILLHERTFTPGARVCVHRSSPKFEFTTVILHNYSLRGYLHKAKFTL